MTPLILAGFLKGPVGLALIGVIVALAAAVTGVTAGPVVVHAVIERINATPEPTAEATARPAAKAKVNPAAQPASPATRPSASPFASPLPKGAASATTQAVPAAVPTAAQVAPPAPVPAVAGTPLPVARPVTRTGVAAPGRPPAPAPTSVAPPAADAASTPEGLVAAVAPEASAVVPDVSATAATAVTAVAPDPAPAAAPVATDVPTATPSPSPSPTPTLVSSPTPTAMPTAAPTTVATGTPTAVPTGTPTPGSAPTGAPSPVVYPAPSPPWAFGYGFQVHTSNVSASTRAAAVGNVKLAGFGWVKHQVEWSMVEPNPNVYDWRELDAMVNADTGAGLNILLSVVHAPEFYRIPSSRLMPSDPATFQRLMQAMASRYAGKVKGYEMWNEENLARETGPGNVDPSNYLPLLKAGYRGTKAGDPTAQVLLGALSPTGVNDTGISIDDLSYLKFLYQLNGGEVKNYFDILAAHVSGFSNPPDCMPSTPQCSLSNAWNTDPSFFAFYRLDQYRDVMKLAGDTNKKMWLSEFGYDSSPVAVPGYEYSPYISEDAQARYLVQAFQIARGKQYIGGVIVWNLNLQMAVPQTDEKWGFSVLRSDFSPRPAFSALASMPKN